MVEPEAEWSDDTTGDIAAHVGESSVASDDVGMLLLVIGGKHVGEIFPLRRDQLSFEMGRQSGIDIPLGDAEISRKHAVIRYDSAERQYRLADLGSRNGTFLNGVPVEGEQPVGIGDKIRLGAATVLRVSAAGDDETRYARTMSRAALRDALTGAYNRRYFDDRLAAEVAFASRHESPLTLLLLDLDHFKEVNDVHGHRAGDLVLRRFVELITEAVRAEDVVIRYGGEEFVVLCRETDQKQASLLAERLRVAVDEADFTCDEVVLHVTVSIGIAGLGKAAADTSQALVDAADRALYAAKKDGRNCCRVVA